MKPLPSIPGESLDDAVERLLAANKSGQHVYMEFTGKYGRKVNLYSNTVSLEQAYIDVYDCTRDRYLKKDTLESFVGLEEMRNKSFELSARTVIGDVGISRLCKLVDDSGRIQSNMADEYIGILSNYADFCKGDKQGEWIENIYDLVYVAGDENATDEKLKKMTDEERQASLEFYELVATVMKLMDDNVDWGQIYTIIQGFNLDEAGILNLKQEVFKYSSRGEEFLKNVFGEDVIAFKKKILESRRNKQ